MRRLLPVFILAAAATHLPAAPDSPGQADGFRLNQIQVVGIHHSYRLAPSPPVRSASRA